MKPIGEKGTGLFRRLKASVKSAFRARQRIVWSERDKTMVNSNLPRFREALREVSNLAKLQERHRLLELASNNPNETRVQELNREVEHLRVIIEEINQRTAELPRLSGDKLQRHIYDLNRAISGLETLGIHIKE